MTSKLAPVTGKTKKEAQEAAPKHPLELEAERLVAEVESLALSFSSLVPMAQAVRGQTEKSWMDFLNARGEAFQDPETGQRIFRIGALLFEEARKLEGKRDRAARAAQVLPRSLLVSLTSAFDAYLGRLIRALFVQNPELLKSIKRELTLDDIRQFERIDQVEEFVLEDEIEGVIRESRRKQFAWMESRFGAPLTKGLECWARFVELSERRNLFVHTDGVVSKQYKRVCKDVGYSWTGGEPPLGSTLAVSKEYFAAACDATMEVGLKLLWVLWRVQAPGQLLEQDRSFLNVTYRLIADDHSLAAAEVLQFAISEKAWKFYDEDSRLRSLLNLAQAYKWSDREAKCKETLSTQAWGSFSPVFRLGASVLDGRFEEAAKILPQAVDVDGLNDATFVQWPIFRDFRKSEEFRAAFAAKFGMEYSSVESSIGAGGELSVLEVASAPSQAVSGAEDKVKKQ